MFLRQYKQTFIVFAFCSLALLFLILIAPDFLVVKHQQINLTPHQQISLRKPTLAEKLKELLNCHDHELFTEKIKHGDYWLIRNLIIGEKSKIIKCAETITYTTHGDFTFFESLPIVIKSWLAPVSFDINKTMESIQYLRNCVKESKLIRDFVSFHVYFPNNHMPKNIPYQPFYISDNKEPIFDEHVSWEGQSNKRIQNFAMCLLNYEYHVLHPAFLTYMPGIKLIKKSRWIQVPAMNRLIKHTIEPEYRKLFGNNLKCRT